MDKATMQDVTERFLPMIADRPFSDEQLNAMRCIRNCRTAEMGAHVRECPECRAAFIHYNSCKNRHCPMCQGMEVDEWIDLRREDVLEAPYFHVVFTIPSQLYSLTYANQRLLYDALYHAANRTLTELSADPKRFGARIGFICVLHTWGSKLNYHPHLHVIVLGGGLDRLNYWKDKGKNFFLPVKVMSAVFKKHYLAELKELREKGLLVYAGRNEGLRNEYAFKELLNTLYGMKWIAYSKKTFAGAREVFKYLGKYTHRIAISNGRIIGMDDKNVMFYAKDYSTDGRYKPYVLSGERFLSRFLLHVLPSGFVKIRYYGLLSCRCKKEKVSLCRKLLGCQEYRSLLRGKTAAEKVKILFGRDVGKCPRCGKELNTYTVRGHYMLC